VGSSVPGIVAVLEPEPVMLVLAESDAPVLPPPPLQLSATASGRVSGTSRLNNRAFDGVDISTIVEHFCARV